MAIALLKLVCPAHPPAGDVLPALRFRLAQLDEITRTYRSTNHEHKRRRLAEVHDRLCELLVLLEQRIAQPSEAVARQQIVADWKQRCFGDDVPPDLRGRDCAMRVLEEAYELAQAEGVTPEQATRLQAYVYGRPPGEPEQEIGGLRVALLAYAAEKGVSADGAEEAEIQHVLAKSLAAVRRRQREKHAAGVAAFSQ